MGTLVNGIKEIFATSKSTATHVPVCASDGTPNGRISVGDLASVLGVGTDISDGDLNSILQSGTYHFQSSRITNLPTDAVISVSNYYILVSYGVSQGGRNSLSQILIGTRDEGVWYRGYSGSGFSSWHKVALDYPTFYKNYSTLAELVTAVGDGIFSYSTTLDNIANISATGVYLSTNNTINKPSSDACFVLAIKIGQFSIYLLEAYGNEGQCHYSGLLRNGNVVWKRTDNV